jgi:hypothetical protein
MSKTIVYNGQSFLNKVLESTGNISNAFEMALLNNVSITDNIAIGTKLEISEITNNYIVDFFNEDNRPATNIIEDIQTSPTLDYLLPGLLPYLL